MSKRHKRAARPLPKPREVPYEVISEDFAATSVLVAGHVIMRIAEGTQHLRFGLRLIQGELHAYDTYTPSQDDAMDTEAPFGSEDGYAQWVAADAKRVCTELRVEVAGTLAETFFRDAWARDVAPRVAADHDEPRMLDVQRAFDWAVRLASLCGVEDVDSEAWVVKETELIFKLVAHHIQAIDKLAEAIANNSVHDALLTADDVRAILGDLEVFRLRREWKQLVQSSALPH